MPKNTTLYLAGNLKPWEWEKWKGVPKNTKLYLAGNLKPWERGGGFDEHKIRSVTLLEQQQTRGTTRKIIRNRNFDITGNIKPYQKRECG